eukprot:9354241-Karenia_brevis.AAC.1
MPASDVVATLRLPAFFRMRADPSWASCILLYETVSIAFLLRTTSTNGRSEQKPKLVESLCGVP